MATIGPNCLLSTACSTCSAWCVPQSVQPCAQPCVPPRVPPRVPPQPLAKGGCKGLSEARLHIDHALQPHAVDHLESLGVGPAVAQDLVVGGRGEPRTQQPRDSVGFHARRVHEKRLQGQRWWDRRRWADTGAQAFGAASHATRALLSGPEDRPEQARGPLERWVERWVAAYIWASGASVHERAGRGQSEGGHFGPCWGARSTEGR